MPKSAIRDELMRVAKIKGPEKNESDAQMLARLQGVISDDITDAEWNSLSEPAQDWNNAAADAIKAGTAIPAFPDEEPDASDAEPQAQVSSRRRGALTNGVQGAVGMEVYKPQVGAPVIVTSKKGVVTKGIVVAIEKDGTLLINPKGKDGDEEDDVEVTAEQIGAIVPAPPPLGDAAGPDTTDDEDANEPEVGDTVTLTTTKDKVYTGNIKEVDDDAIIITEASGTEREFSQARVKSVVVNVKAKGATKAADKAAVAAQSNPPAPAPAPAAAGRRRGAAAAPAEPEPKEPEPAAAATGRRRGSAAAPAAGDKVVERAPAGVGGRARQLIVESHKSGKPITLEALEKKLKAEGLEWRGATVSMVFKDTNAIIKHLED